MHSQEQAPLFDPDTLIPTHEDAEVPQSENKTELPPLAEQPPPRTTNHNPGRTPDKSYVLNRSGVANSVALDIADSDRRVQEEHAFLKQSTERFLGR